MLSLALYQVAQVNGVLNFFLMSKKDAPFHEKLSFYLKFTENRKIHKRK